MSPAPMRVSRVFTLDELIARDRDEAELWSWIARPSERVERQRLLRHWRQAKALARREGDSPVQEA